MAQKKRYDHAAIESKWQKYWEENKTFEVHRDPSKPKYYILDMFPYPSGSGLHVGHVAGYTATDTLARHKRQKGFDVLHPMGWDSFGLPAEQYAVQTGTHPAETTKKNVDTFRRQLKSLGFSYDWTREIATSDPRYYKWTQWIFTKLFERGLAYEAEMMVNYCPTLGTVLANEEVENGRSVLGGYEVVRRPLRQWVLKITAYADRLLEDLDLVDWPEGLKRLQRNWIGRSEGAKVRFVETKTQKEIEVFTTRSDTLFGATFLVLSPESSLVEQITTPEQRAVVEEYQKTAALKSDLERTELSKEKTGVFTGAYALNPVSGKEVPIWIADYVLSGYGTGAVMAVPAHDERDFEFATKFQLPITPVYTPDLATYPEEIPEGMTAEQANEAVLAGKQCWPHDGTCINSARDGLDLNGLSVKEATERTISWIEEQGCGERWVNYKLRDWLFSRQRYWGEPFPILHLEDGTKRALGPDELPLTPPEISDYKPAGDGQSPLAKAKEWVEIVDPKTGKKALRETNTMPQWAGSCWYYLRFCDPCNDEQAWDPEKEKAWLPVDMYVGGVEHAVLHLLYARFWHKVLYDCGYVHNREPFHTLRNPGLITARSYRKEAGGYVHEDDVEVKNGQYFYKETGEELISQIDKMGKSKLNGVSPDEIVEEFGADSLRLYELFMGPLEKEKVWNTDAVSGCFRFVNRFYDMVHSDKVCEEDSEEATKLSHRLIHGVEQELEKLQFNTAIAKMMEFINAFTKLDAYPQSALRLATLALSSFAPHLAEECWETLGGTGTLAYHSYPQADANYLVDETVTYVVQVNGKLRGRLDLPKDKDQEALVELAKKEPSVDKHINGSEILKVIFVPNKLLNFVVKK